MYAPGGCAAGGPDDPARTLWRRRSPQAHQQMHSRWWMRMNRHGDGWL